MFKLHLTLNLFFRMFWINHLVYILLLSFIPAVKNHDTNNEESHESFTKLAQAQRIQSPMLEVLMRLPRNFHDINSFKNFLRVKPDRLVNSKRSGKPNPRDVVDVQTYEIAQPDPRNKSSFDRPKREADQSSLEKPVHQQLVSSLTETDLGKKFSNSEMLIPVADAIRGPAFTAFPVKNFEGTDTDDPDHSKRRRDDSINNREDNSQRDKRTFPDVGLDQNESTTPLPFWKRKKENPPFITGRGSTPKANDYGAPQHRSADNGLYIFDEYFWCKKPFKNCFRPIPPRL